jgi:hypothetical protein
MADVLGFLRKGFPFLATALSLGGPPGNLAAAALGKVLAIDKPTPANVLKALETDISPEKLEQFKQPEAELAAQMKLAGYDHAEDMEALAAADRADARQREIKTGDKWTPRVLAGCMVLAWFSIEGFLLHQAFHGGPEPSSAMSQIVGSISRMADAAVTLVLGYYFGSSAGRDHSTGVEQQNAH